MAIFIMRNAILSLGATPTDYAGQVSSATLTPTTGTAVFKGLKPDAVSTFPTAPTYALDIEYAQDWASPETESLSRYLWEHKGETVPAILDPDDGSTPWAMDVIIVPGAVGGAVDSVATATVSLGVVGEPVPTFPVTPLEDAPTAASDDVTVDTFAE